MSSFFKIISFFFFFSLFSVGICTYSCPNTCVMPTCNCASTSIPGNLTLAETPQFILFTLDDSIYERDFHTLGNLSYILQNNSILDSNGCHPKLTYYTMQTCNPF